jgi:glutaminase
LIKLEELNINSLSVWVQQAKTQARQGSTIQHIPLLAVADPHRFAVHICCQSGKNYNLGDTACVFPLMSVIKPYSLLYLLNHFELVKVREWIDSKPSEASFNSLEQLITDHGQPRNPMINSGAITLADKLPGEDANNRVNLFCEWLNRVAGCQLSVDIEMLTSVRAARSLRNIEIAHHLSKSGYINNLEIVLDTYEQICCLSGTVYDLALLGKLLACQNDMINWEDRRLVNALMFTCGLYEASAQYAVRIGLPMKSGIGGGLIAIVPNQGAIACYSPTLDNIGNPVAGLALIETLSQNLQLSVFI